MVKRWIKGDRSDKAQIEFSSFLNDCSIDNSENFAPSSTYYVNHALKG